MLNNDSSFTKFTSQDGHFLDKFCASAFSPTGAEDAEPSYFIVVNNRSLYLALHDNLEATSVPETVEPFCFGAFILFLSVFDVVSWLRYFVLSMLLVFD